jgi:Na+/H+ antiporter NhaA
MSLFIAALAFEEPFLTQAKLGILVGSTVAGALGLLVLRGAAPTEPERPEWEGGDA